MMCIFLQAIRCTVPNCSCERFVPGKCHLRYCETCKHGWVHHGEHFYIVFSNISTIQTRFFTFLLPQIFLIQISTKCTVTHKIYETTSQYYYWTKANWRKNSAVKYHYWTQQWAIKYAFLYSSWLDPTQNWTASDFKRH